MWVLLIASKLGSIFSLGGRMEDDGSAKINCFNVIQFSHMEPMYIFELSKLKEPPPPPASLDHYVCKLYQKKCIKLMISEKVHKINDRWSHYSTLNTLTQCGDIASLPMQKCFTVMSCTVCTYTFPVFAMAYACGNWLDYIEIIFKQDIEGHRLFLK